jgi:hypothetical protein
MVVGGPSVDDGEVAITSAGGGSGSYDSAVPDALRNVGSEVAAVADPRRAASGSTEGVLRLNPIVAPFAYGSDALDVLSDREPPQGSVFRAAQKAAPSFPDVGGDIDYPDDPREALGVDTPGYAKPAVGLLAALTVGGILAALWGQLFDIDLG